ncbi:MAG: PIN domain-containing protein [Thermoanaerobaculales bacterium]|nr:PIN domain-containing protein [Thermoanaerobaculales bacterium]
MSVDAFLDTNVLIYAVSSAPAESAKKERALELISHADFGLSAQVLQEFYVNVTGKIALPLMPDEAVALLEQFRNFPVVWMDYPLIVAGIEVALRFGISYWDGAIIAAAERLGATTLYTEDLNHGQRYASVQAVNPFLPGKPDSVHEGGGPQYG